jgi:hypothetical protein
MKFLLQLFYPTLWEIYTEFASCLQSGHAQKGPINFLAIISTLYLIYICIGLKMFCKFLKFLSRFDWDEIGILQRPFNNMKGFLSSFASFL